MKPKFSTLTTSATRAFHKAGFQLKKHSPEILVITGVIGTVVSAVMACKATTKLSTIVEKTKTDVDMIHECVNNPEFADQYSVEDSKKDLTIVYAKTGVEIAKLYAPAVIVGALSITSILTGHHILHKRNLATAAAFTAADTAFKQYRGRVVERLGEKMDKELLYNIKAKTIEETVVDEDGNETTVTKTVEVAEHKPSLGLYTYCFDETASCWQRDAEDNKYFLLRQQDWANDLLKSRGYLFLNEVLDMLGIPRTRVGQAVGWMLNGDGDGYVDFGIFDIHKEANRSFVNGLEKSIWLDFNVDGDILNNF